MYRLAILCAVETEGTRKAIQTLTEEFSSHEIEVRFRESQEARVPDILAVDLLVLGSQDSSSLHPDFAEIRRALSGMNLAGRMAGLLDFGNGSTEEFRKALKDTDIDIFKEELELTDNHDNAVIRGWATRMVKAFQELAE